MCEYNGVINVLYYQNYTVKPHYSNNCLLAWNELAKPWQGERVLQISTDKNGRMGAKIKTQKKSLGLQTKPQKIPGPKFNPKKSQFPNHKISRGTMPPGYTGTIKNLQIVLNTPKYPYLNQATQKNTCQNFPTSKNPEIENFKPQRIL